MVSDISSLVSGQVKQTGSTAAPGTSTATASAKSEATDAFGPAYQLDVNPAAKTSTEPSVPAVRTAPPVAGQSAATIDTASLVSAAKRKVEPLVGASGASQVVDSHGNISKAKLAEVIAEQSIKF